MLNKAQILFNSISCNYFSLCFSKRIFERPDVDYQPMPEAERPGGFNFGGEPAAGQAEDENEDR